MEFKYFKTKSGEKIISSDFVVGEEEFIRTKVKSVPLPKTDEEKFLSSLDRNGLKVFKEIIEFGKEKGLIIRWGSKGFSLNCTLDGGLVVLFWGFPLNSAFKQTVYTGFEEITKKVHDSKEIIEFYKRNLENLGYFAKAGNNLKWVIDKSYSDEEIKRFFYIIEKVTSMIKEKGLK